MNIHKYLSDANSLDAQPGCLFTIRPQTKTKEKIANSRVRIEKL
jgi:hypothetical protein